jgi:hypothetical protein
MTVLTAVLLLIALAALRFGVPLAAMMAYSRLNEMLAERWEAEAV